MLMCALVDSMVGLVQARTMLLVIVSMREIDRLSSEIVVDEVAEI